MKPIGFILVTLLAFSCSPYKDPAYTKKKPGSHILTSNKSTVKENIKLQKEQAKTAQKKREELSYLNGDNVNSGKLIKKKKKK